MVMDDRAAVILVDGGFLSGMGVYKAAGAQGCIARAFDCAFYVSVVNGDHQVVGFLRRDRGVCDACCDSSDAPLSR